MRKVNPLLVLSILGGFIVIATAIVQYRKEKKDKIELDAKDAEIKKLLYQQNSSLTEANQLQQKVIDVQAELVESNKKITLLNEEIKNNITGGDSKPILSLFFEPYGNYTGVDTNYITAKFQIINKDKYPLKAVRIIITDYESGVKGVVTKEGTNSYTVQMEPQAELNDLKKTFTFETISSTSGYLDFYKGRLVRDIATFNYSIDLQWLTGHMFYNISGTIDQETKRIHVTDIFPLSQYANPLELVEIYPQFVGGKLSRFKNPLKQ